MERHTNDSHTMENGTRVCVCLCVCVSNAGSVRQPAPDTADNVTDTDDVSLSKGGHSHVSATGEADPIQLAIFSHRFMGIAEQMGRTLQRTSIR